jgi:hypothetical protein
MTGTFYVFTDMNIRKIVVQTSDHDYMLRTISELEFAPVMKAIQKKIVKKDDLVDAEDFLKKLSYIVGETLQVRKVFDNDFIRYSTFGKTLASKERNITEHKRITIKKAVRIEKVILEPGDVILIEGTPPAPYKVTGVYDNWNRFEYAKNEREAYEIFKKARKTKTLGGKPVYPNTVEIRKWAMPTGMMLGGREMCWVLLSDLNESLNEEDEKKERMSANKERIDDLQKKLDAEQDETRKKQISAEIDKLKLDTARTKVDKNKEDLSKAAEKEKEEKGTAKKEAKQPMTAEQGVKEYLEWVDRADMNISYKDYVRDRSNNSDYGAAVGEDLFNKLVKKLKR